MNALRPLRMHLPAAGLQVHGRRTGPAGGQPLLLLHGWPDWSHAWRPVLQRLGPGLDAVAPDLRGFGATQPRAGRPDATAGPERHADDLLALADARWFAPRHVPEL